MSDQNCNQNDDTICPICLQEIQESLKCTGCKNQFCKLCVLKWKQLKDLCPLKCNSDKWLINLDNVNEENSDGFIVCPFDNNVGNMNCRKCQKPLIFKKQEKQKIYKCKKCQSPLEFYINTTFSHENCFDQYSNYYYYYCVCCNFKICECIEKLQQQ